MLAQMTINRQMTQSGGESSLQREEMLCKSEEGQGKQRAPTREVEAGTWGCGGWHFDQKTQATGHRRRQETCQLSPGQRIQMGRCYGRLRSGRLRVGSHMESCRRPAAGAAQGASPVLPTLELRSCHSSLGAAASLGRQSRGARLLLHAAPAQRLHQAAAVAQRGGQAAAEGAAEEQRAGEGVAERR